YQSVLALKSGQYVTGGNSSNQSNGNIELRQLDQFGSTVWFNKNTSTHNLVTSMLRLPGNGFYLGGSYIRFNNFSFMRTDSLGNLLWSKDYSWSMNDRFWDMKFARNGDIVGVGTTSYPVGPWHIKVMRVNQQGDSLNGKQLIVTGPSRYEGMDPNFNSITALTDGGFLITAYTDTATAT